MALHWKTIERLNTKLEDMVDEWHESSSELTLAQYLRLDWPEYTAWASNYKAIPEDWESREEGWQLACGSITTPNSLTME